MNEQKKQREVISGLSRKYRAERLALEILNKSEMLTMIADNQEPFFVWVSESWSNYLGWTFDELTNTSFFEFIHPDDIAPSAKAFEAFQKSGYQNAGFKGDYFINRYKAKDGTYKRVEWMRMMESDGHNFIMFANGID